MAPRAVASSFLLTTRQRDPPPRQREELLLELNERLSVRIGAPEVQVLPADVTDDAAPQGVVEVDDHELSRHTEYTPEAGTDVARRLGEDVAREGDLARVPELRVERPVVRRREPALRVENERIGDLRGCVCEA